MFFVMSIAGKTCFFKVHSTTLLITHSTLFNGKASAISLKSASKITWSWPCNALKWSKEMPEASPKDTKAESGERRLHGFDGVARRRRKGQISELRDESFLSFTFADLPTAVFSAKFSGTHHSRELEWETVSVIVCMRIYWNFHMIGTKIKGTWDLRNISSGALQEPFGTVQRLPPTVNFPRQDSG